VNRASVTLKQIAKEVGVSIQAVSRVLSGGPPTVRVSPQRAAEILEAAKRLGYITGRPVKTRQPMTVGVVAVDRPFHSLDCQANHEFVHGIEQELEAVGYHALALRFTDVLETDTSLLRPATPDTAKRWSQSNPNRLDGVIVVGRMPAAIEQAILQTNAHRVWLCSHAPQTEVTVSRDEVMAGRTAARRLHSQHVDGQRTQGVATTYVVSPDPDRHHKHAISDRQKGIREESRLVGSDIQEVYIKSLTHCVDWMSTLTSRAQLVSTSHVTARTVVMACAKHGLKLGRDIRLVCSDDAADAESWASGLTRVRFNRLEMGRTAAQLIANLIGDHPAQSVKTVPDDLIPGWTDGL
jgi:DNA-binding LacI/PurR family transcriptional regulator